jgi:hypothetical protein
VTIVLDHAGAQTPPVIGTVAGGCRTVGAMYAVATFLVVAVITVAFTKVATGALIATGVPPASAAFQARSAFSGAGFTTTEAENVVNQPIRRRIIGTTMLVGSLGTPTLVVTVLVGMLAPGPGSTTERALVTVSGLFLIVITVVNKPVQAWLEGVGHRYIQRRVEPSLDDHRNELLLLSDEFSIQSVRLVGPIDAVRSLRGLAHAIPEVTVLAIRRGDDFIGEPPVDIDLVEGDELILYGRRPDEERSS